MWCLCNGGGDGGILEEGCWYLPEEGLGWEKVMFPDTTYILYTTSKYSSYGYGSTVHYSTVVL